ncbi:MAG: hypothetical protein IKV90_10455 [Clostridia bacterium]|nr:hypothetical protein [Clostridia bacterium]
MNMKWKDMPLSHKIATVVACIALAIWMISHAKPALFPVDVTCPAIALFTVCEAVTYWKEKRKWAYLFIAGAVISMVCYILQLSL